MENIANFMKEKYIYVKKRKYTLSFITVYCAIRLASMRAKINV